MEEERARQKKELDAAGDGGAPADGAAPASRSANQAAVQRIEKESEMFSDELKKIVKDGCPDGHPERARLEGEIAKKLVERQDIEAAMAAAAPAAPAARLSPAPDSVAGASMTDAELAAYVQQQEYGAGPSDHDAELARELQSEWAVTDATAAAAASDEVLADEDDADAELRQALAMSMGSEETWAER